MDGKRFIQWEYIIFYTGRDYRPNNVLQKLKNWRPVPASPLLLLPWIIYLSENVWIIVPVLICKRLNIHLYSSALSLIRLCRQVVRSPESRGINRIAYNASLLLNSSPPDSLIRHNDIQRDCSGLFNNRTARLFVFYQCSIPSFLTKIFLNFTLFTFFHNLIFTDRRKFIMWEPIFLGQSFFTSFPISLTTFTSSSSNCKQQQKQNMFISSCSLQIINKYHTQNTNLEYL